MKKIFFFAFISLNFIFSTLPVVSAQTEMNQNDPYLWVRVYQKGKLICSFIIEKNLISVNLESFNLERVDLLTQNNLFSPESEYNPTKFYDFEDEKSEGELKEEIIKEVTSRENGNPRDRIGIIKIFLKN